MTDSIVPTPRPITETWTLADSQQLQEVGAALPKEGTPEHPVWLEKYRAVSDRLTTCLAEHMAHLARTGAIVPIDTQGRLLNWTAAWNAVFTKKDWRRPAQDAVRDLAANLDMALSMTLFREKTPSVEDVHAAVHKRITEGNWRWRTQEAHECFRTGERIVPDITGWSVQLGQRILRDRTFLFEPCTETALRHAAEHHILPVPSGELWAADWCRMPALIAVKEKFDAQHERTPSPDYRDISSAEGRAQATRRYAALLGIAHMSVGDRSQDLMGHQGCVVGGEVHEDARLPKASSDPSTPVALGETCSDLWWVTLADRAVLRDLMAKEVGEEEANRQLAEFAAKPPFGFHILHVPPGTYHLYAAADPGDFAASFADRYVADHLALDRITPTFVLSPTPLPPREEPAPPKRSVRP